MLRIKVELVPYGDETKTRQIAEMVIANVNSLDTPQHLSRYEGWIAADDWSGEPSLFGRVNNFNRSQSVWELIRLMIGAAKHEHHAIDTDENSTTQRLKKRLSSFRDVAQRRYVDLWHWFGLSYTGYLVFPRAVICDMPKEYQHKILDTLQYIDDNYKTDKMPGKYMVRATSNGKFIKDPLAKYRNLNMKRFRKNAKEMPAD